MSAREFEFGSIVKLKKGLINTLYVCTDFTPDGTSGGMLISCHGEDGSWIRVHDTQLEPSAQPHVAAGMGFKERLIQCTVEYARAMSDFGKSPNDARLHLVNASWDKLNALLAEVVELPSVDLKTIQETADQYVVDFGQEISLQLAAALIRAATQSPAKPPQA